MNKGIFILFEGIDGAGKSTQCDRLYRYALDSGLKTVKLYEPTNGIWGKKIREMLSMEPPPPVEEQINMFIQDRVEDVSSNINPALAKGDIVIMDRYFYSNAAYQGSGLFTPEKIIKKNLDMNFPLPDRVYFLDLDPESALERIKKRNPAGMEIFEKYSFLKKVRENFFSVMNETFLVIDGNNPPDIIFSIIQEDFNKLIKEQP